MKTQNTSPLLVAQDNNKEVVSNQEVVSKVIVQTLKEEKCKSVMKNSISNSISPSIEDQTDESPSIEDQTDESPAFIEMLQEFKPSDTAFLIYQNKENNKKVGSRNLLFTCNCGVKVRTAKNENKPLNAMCLYCNSEFKQSGEEFAQ